MPKKTSETGFDELKMGIQTPKSGERNRERKFPENAQLKQLLGNIRDTIGSISFLPLMHAIGEKFRSVYPDANDQFLAYHTVVGSSPDKDLPYFDAPGPESLQKILTDIYASLLAEQAAQQFDIPSGLSLEERKHLLQDHGFYEVPGEGGLSMEELRRSLAGQAVLIVNILDDSPQIFANVHLETFHENGDKFNGFKLPDGRKVFIEKIDKMGKTTYPLKRSEGWMFKPQKFKIYDKVVGNLE
jgi:hypothetical protein